MMIEHYFNENEFEIKSLLIDELLSVKERRCKDQRFNLDWLPIVEESLSIISSRPLKIIFERDIVTIQYLAEFIHKAPKSSHGSFEVISSRSQNYVYSIPKHTFVKVAS